VSVGQARANAWTTYSDRRVKTDIQEISEKALQLISALRPVRYYHHSSYFENGRLVVLEEGTYRYGFLAQELTKVLPEAVYVPEDESKELWGVNYEMFIPILTAALQSQQREIEQQREEIKVLRKKAQRVDELESRLAALEAKMQVDMQ